jgi:spore germination protein YaaH
MGQKIVFGYHPFWAGSAWQHYRFDRLTHIAHFSAEVDPLTGNIAQDRGWSTSSMLTKAQLSGVKAILACSNIGAASNTTLLAQATRRATLIAALVELVKKRHASGVNIDFEQVPVSQRVNLVKFAEELIATFRSQAPGTEISFAIPAVDWSKSYDMVALSVLCDYLVLRGYDYNWRGSKTAGPVAPLQGSLSISRSVETYLASGVAPGKLVVAVPYYGYDWPVQDGKVHAATTGPGTAIVYRAAKEGAAEHGRNFDAATQSPYYRYQNGETWHQAWYEDAESLRAKYDLVKSRGLAGAGIWALSYDGSNTELWDALGAAFFEPPVGSPSAPVIAPPTT